MLMPATSPREAQSAAQLVKVQSIQNEPRPDPERKKDHNKSTRKLYLESNMKAGKNSMFVQSNLHWNILAVYSAMLSSYSISDGVFPCSFWLTM